MSALEKFDFDSGQHMRTLLGENAIVIGGSIAGFMTARVLSDHFENVIVLERDHVLDEPVVRRSIPQGNHLHALLLSGQQTLARLYPGFTEKLLTLGAVRLRLGKDNAVLLPDRKAYSFGGAVTEPRDLGIDLYCQSRGLLEYCIRQCAKEQQNITLRSECAVRKLISRDTRVSGVVYDYDGGSHTLKSDLVIDTGGRGSHAARWLSELGFTPAAETSIGIDFAYASTKFGIPNYSESERLLSVRALGPDDPNVGIMEEIEGNLFHLSLGGRFGQYPPSDEQGFLAFAKSLHTPKLYELVKDAQRVSAITTYRFPTSVRRHYERLVAFPEGFLVLGDAISSFNPLYGQGMSSAALQVQALQGLLNESAQERTSLDGLASTFFAKAAEIVDAPWTLAANADFAYPKTTGKRPPNLDGEGSQYFAALEELCAEDIRVHILTVEVFNLVKPLSILFEEPLRNRIREHMSRRTTKSEIVTSK